MTRNILLLSLFVVGNTECPPVLNRTTLPWWSSSITCRGEDEEPQFRTLARDGVNLHIHIYIHTHPCMGYILLQEISCGQSEGVHEGGGGGLIGKQITPLNILIINHRFTIGPSRHPNSHFYHHPPTHSSWATSLGNTVRDDACSEWHFLHNHHHWMNWLVGSLADCTRTRPHNGRLVGRRDTVAETVWYLFRIVMPSVVDDEDNFEFIYYDIIIGSTPIHSSLILPVVVEIVVQQQQKDSLELLIDWFERRIDSMARITIYGPDPHDQSHSLVHNIRDGWGRIKS